MFVEGFLRQQLLPSCCLQIQMLFLSNTGLVQWSVSDSEVDSVHLLITLILLIWNELNVYVLLHFHNLSQLILGPSCIVLSRGFFFNTVSFPI